MEIMKLTLATITQLLFRNLLSPLNFIVYSLIFDVDTHSSSMIENYF